MTSFDIYVRRVFFGTLSLILVIAGIFLFFGRIPWARGVVLGGIASLVNLVVMASDVKRQGQTVGGQLVRPAVSLYTLRMTIIAVALIYSATSGKIAFWAVVPALFTSRFVMICGELLGNRKQETT